jgi:hypothetical protein
MSRGVAEKDTPQVTTECPLHPRKADIRSRRNTGRFGPKAASRTATSSRPSIIRRCEKGHRGGWIEPQVDASSKNVALFAVVQCLGGFVVYAVMALARNMQSKTAVKMESGKSTFAGERSSQRNCLSNSS